MEGWTQGHAAMPWAVSFFCSRK